MPYMGRKKAAATSPGVKCGRCGVPWSRDGNQRLRVAAAGAGGEMWVHRAERKRGDRVLDSDNRVTVERHEGGASAGGARGESE